MTKQAKKAVRKFSKLRKKGALKRHTKDKLKDIQIRKGAKSRKRVLNIEEDWAAERSFKEAQDDDDDILPLDMLDADLDWDSTGFVAKKRRRDATFAQDADGSVFEEGSRNFGGDYAESMEHLLPIKTAGGLVVPRVRKVEDAASTSEHLDNDPDEATNGASLDSIHDDHEQQSMVEDYSKLSAAELCSKRLELLAEGKRKIASNCHQLMIDPHAEINRLKELLKMACGEKQNPLIRESLQKLATVSLCEVFADIIPGYRIRPPTETEMTQKLKKDTKKLVDFESTLLRNYKKYLQHLEYCTKVLRRGLSASAQDAVTCTFSGKLALIAVECLCKLLTRCPHFNFASNVVQLMVRLTTTNWSQVTDRCCETIVCAFKSDSSGEMCLEGAKAIGKAVQQSPNHISPSLLGCLLALRIKKIDTGKADKEKDVLMKKKYQLKREHKSKKERKYDKQMKKLEQELKEAEAAQNIDSQLKLNTQTMNHVFVTYFRVIRRLAKTQLLGPVLEGLSQFAHLINVEFFDDIIASLHALLATGELNTMDGLHCAHTVFVILSGEGVALNIDPCRFYKAVYGLLPKIALERNRELQMKQAHLALRTLDLMLNQRRKQISHTRVSAFVKRMVLLALKTPVPITVAILAAIRTYFVSHPPSASQLLDPETQGSGRYSPIATDPDHCNASCTNIVVELRCLAENHPVEAAKSMARHMLNQMPSTGANRLNPELATQKPFCWLDDPSYISESQDDAFNCFSALGGKIKGGKDSSDDISQQICAWLSKYYSSSKN